MDKDLAEKQIAADREMKEKTLFTERKMKEKELLSVDRQSEKEIALKDKQMMIDRELAEKQMMIDRELAERKMQLEIEMKAAEAFEKDKLKLEEKMNEEKLRIKSDYESKLELNKQNFMLKSERGLLNSVGLKEPPVAVLVDVGDNLSDVADANELRRQPRLESLFTSPVNASTSSATPMADRNSVLAYGYYPLQATKLDTCLQQVSPSISLTIPSTSFTQTLTSNSFYSLFLFLFNQAKDKQVTQVAGSGRIATDLQVVLGITLPTGVARTMGEIMGHRSPNEVEPPRRAESPGPWRGNSNRGFGPRRG